MNLVMAIVNKDDAHGLAYALQENGYASTLVGTTGGFLRKGNSTFLMGVEENEIESLLSLIKENCKTRTRMVNPMPAGESDLSRVIEVEVGGAVVFVLSLDRFGKY